MATLKHYIKLSRPFTLISPAIGFLGGSVMAWRATAPTAGLPWGAWAGAIAAMLLNAYSNSLNQIYDIEIDRINQPSRPLPSGQISARGARAFTVASLVAALAIAAAVSIALLAVFAAAAFATYIYSAPPLRTKARGMWANLTIAVARGLLLFVSGWTAVALPATPAPWAAGAILGLYVFGAASTKDFADIEGDRAFGIKTLPVTRGPAAAARIMAPFLIVPFLLVPAAVSICALHRAAMPVTLLAAYGAYIAVLLIRDYGGPARRNSRASWVHMYLLLILAQAGFGICYWIFR